MSDFSHVCMLLQQQISFSFVSLTFVIRELGGCAAIRQVATDKAVHNGLSSNRYPSWGKSSSNRHYTIRLTKFDKFSAATLC